MKLLYLLLICLLTIVVLIPPISASYSYNFQNAGDFTGIVCVGGTGCSWAESGTGGNNYLVMQWDGSVARNGVAEATTYFAVTTLNTGGPYIHLYDSSLVQMANLDGGSAPGRIEVVMIGGQAHVYKDGIATTTSGVLAQNPSYIGVESHGAGPTYFDDLVYGSSVNKYITGAPENIFVIKKDMINPANSGLSFANNGTVVRISTLPYSWSRSNVTDAGLNRTVTFTSFGNGVNYGTAYTGMAASGSGTFQLDPVTNVSSNAPFGFYTIEMQGVSAYSNLISFIGEGASIAWNSKTYSQSDTATITYSIATGYWNTTGYAYKLAVQDVFGNFIGTNQTLTTQSGTKTFTFSTSYNTGVYYAGIWATPTSGGPILMNYDYTTLTGYITIVGFLNDQTCTPVSGANVNITQGPTVVNTTSGFNGNVTGTGFQTGSLLVVNATKSGYRQYVGTFTPQVAKSIQLNITLVPITVSETGSSIGGVARDTTYGNPLSGVSVVVQNLTTLEQHTVSTNACGWYLCDNGAACYLTSARPYAVSGSKTGYSNSSTYTVVAP
jgi:hypothetical protein